MDENLKNYQAYLDGDDTGLERLLDAYGKRLILFLTRITKDAELAEELMEDTICDLLIFRREFRGDSALQTYLFAAARNKAVSELRRRARHCEEMEEHVTESFESECIADLGKRCLYNALLALPRDYRIALYLVYFENMSYRETGQIMKCSERRIKNLIYRGKAALRAYFEKEGLTYEELV